MPLSGQLIGNDDLIMVHVTKLGALSDYRFAILSLLPMPLQGFFFIACRMKSGEAWEIRSRD